MKKVLVLFAAVIMFTISLNSSAEAAVKFEEKRGVVLRYGENGGFLYSIALVVNSRIDYNPPSVPNPDYNNVTVSVTASTPKSSFTLCGGNMDVHNKAKMGSNTLPLYNYTWDTIGDATTAYKRADSRTHTLIKGVYNVEVGAGFTSQCGSGNVTHNYSFSNN